MKDLAKLPIAELVRYLAKLLRQSKRKHPLKDLLRSMKKRETPN